MVHLCPVVGIDKTSTPFFSLKKERLPTILKNQIEALASITISLTPSIKDSRRKTMRNKHILQKEEEKLCLTASPAKRDR